MALVLNWSRSGFLFLFFSFSVWQCKAGGRAGGLVFYFTHSGLLWFFFFWFQIIIAVVVVFLPTFVFLFGI